MQRAKRSQKIEKNVEKKSKIKEKFVEVLELPKEIVLDVPKITMIGNQSILIENYKGIAEYEATRIRINTKDRGIKIIGERLTIKEITSEDIMISGSINGIEFMY